MPEAFPGYCSTTCLMGVFNYFWYTTFNMKDTRDIIRLGLLWKYKHWDMLDQIDIAYCLHQLWFTINIYYQMSSDDYDYMLEYPILAFKKTLNQKYHSAIQWDTYTHTSGLTMKITSDLFIKIKNSTSIEQHFEVDFVDVIKKDQSENTLFLLWLDGYILLDEPYPSDDFVSWHVVLCSWFKDWYFQIYDSWPQKNPLLIDEDKLRLAMTKTNQYMFVSITSDI